jgi:hypothetical protein
MLHYSHLASNENAMGECDDAVESYDNAIRDAEGKREISYRWFPLDANTPDDPQVASMIGTYKQESP